MNTSGFGASFSKMTNEELALIASRPDDHLPEAVLAAQKELAARQVNLEAVAATLPPPPKPVQEAIKEKAQKAEHTVFRVAGKIIRRFNPFLPGLSQEEKAIRLLVLFFGSISIDHLFSGYSLIKMLTNDFSLLSAFTIVTTLLYILFPVAIFLFWKKKTIGWTLFLVFLLNSGLTILASAVMGIANNYFSGPAIDNASSILSILFSLAYYFGSVYLICRSDIRGIYRISMNRMSADIAVGVMFTILTLFIMFQSI